MSKLLINWSSKYSVGLSTIDQQHQKLVEIINRLFLALKQGVANEFINRVIEEMVQYAIIHFETEEKYFNEFNYSETDAHIAEHKAFERKISDFIKDLEMGKVSLTYDVMNFLKDWLTNHIAKSDKKYIECFKANGVV